MTALDVGYAALAFGMFVGFLICMAGWTENRRDRKVDRRVMDSWRDRHG